MLFISQAITVGEPSCASLCLSLVYLSSCVLCAVLCVQGVLPPILHKFYYATHRKERTQLYEFVQEKRHLTGPVPTLSESRTGSGKMQISQTQGDVRSSGKLLNASQSQSQLAVNQKQPEAGTRDQGTTVQGQGIQEKSSVSGRPSDAKSCAVQSQRGDEDQALQAVPE